MLRRISPEPEPAASLSTSAHTSTWARNEEPIFRLENELWYVADGDDNQARSTDRLKNLQTAQGDR
ncbi:MAG TPA: hypothetical protein VJ124_02375 [Pyrinomonadaceae bacterium]|nr:hypothetical protein [Pyrinomonadaceae bacterium]